MFKHSKQISNLMGEQLEANDGDFGELWDLADSTCTSGYDNDGSTGTEIFENGAKLGFCAGHENLQIFGVSGDSCDFFFLGKSEDDAVALILVA